MTKPKINLTDPVVSAALETYRQQATLAFDLAAIKDDSVRPVYALNNRTQSVRQVGSCVLLRVKDQMFALSASHVFDDVAQYQLLFGHGEQLHPFSGDRFSTSKGPSGTHRDDPIDASVFHMGGAVAAEIRESALTLQDLDIAAAHQATEFYVAVGYRASKSRSTSNGHSSHLDRYPTLEVCSDHYEHWVLSREWHLLLAFEDQVLIRGSWQTAPSISGFSGGAMFRITGLSPVSNFTTQDISNKVKLAAILIERRKGARNKFHSAAVGTRLGVHFGLIHRYLPELGLDQMLACEYERQTRIQRNDRLI